MRLILLFFLGFSAQACAEGSVAFLGLHFLDVSQQSTVGGNLAQPEPLADDLARVANAEVQVAQRFTAEGFTILDLAPVTSELERVTNPANCYGCDQRIASKLGADFVLVGEVRKTSNALLSMNLQLRDAATGAIVKGGSADIRGNTDALWARGMRHILNYRIFREEQK